MYRQFFLLIFFVLLFTSLSSFLQRDNFQNEDEIINQQVVMALQEADNAPEPDGADIRFAVSLKSRKMYAESIVQKVTDKFTVEKRAHVRLWHFGTRDHQGFRDGDR